MKPKLHFIGIAVSLVLTACIGLYTLNTTVDKANMLNKASQAQISQDITQRLEAERRWTQETLKFELAAITTEQKITNSLLHRIIKSSGTTTHKIIAAEEVSVEVDGSTSVIDSYNTRNSNNVIYYPRTKLD